MLTFTGPVTVYCKCDLSEINRKLEKIMATQAQTAQELRDMKVQNEKARQENLQKLKALQDAIDQAGLNSSQEVVDAMDDLKQSIQADDDENPDQDPPPPPPEQGV